jgi:hypothetical protein
MPWWIGTQRHPPVGIPITTPPIVTRPRQSRIAVGRRFPLFLVLTPPPPTPTTITLSIPTCRAGIPSPDQAPPRYLFEAVAGSSRHNTHFPSGQLPPLEPRPSSPVTLPSFNALESIIRASSPPGHEPNLMTRYPQNSPASSVPHLNVWKSENSVIDQPSAGSTLAGQQLNVPAPSLPTSYPG